MKRLSCGVVCVLLLAICMGAKPRWPWSVKADFSANPAVIVKGEKSTLTWNCSRSTRRAEIDGQLVPLSGSREVWPEKTTNYTLTAHGRRLVYSRMIMVGVVTPAPLPPVPPEPIPDPTPTPDPIPPEPGPQPEPQPDPVLTIRTIIIEETETSTRAFAVVRNSAKIRKWAEDNGHVLFFLDKDSAAKSKTFKLWADKAIGKTLPYLFVTAVGNDAVIWEAQAPEKVDAFLSILTAYGGAGVVKAAPKAATVQSSCPGGVCPLPGRSLLRRR